MSLGRRISDWFWYELPIVPGYKTRREILDLFEGTTRDLNAATRDLRISSRLLDGTGDSLVKAHEGFHKTSARKEGR